MSDSANQPTSDYESSSPGERRVFATTSWSMVLQASDPENPTAAREALANLCEAYWFPLYSFIRRKGNGRDEAEDLTQAFFAELLEKERLNRADRERGRFRTFLLTSLNNFISNDWREKQALKRGGGRTPISFDFDDADQRYTNLPHHELTPEKIFERNWAFALLEQTMANVRSQYEDSGKATLFEELKGVITGQAVLSYEAIAQRLEMKEGAIKVAVHRLRQRYGEQLRMQIARTIDDPANVDVELQALFSALNPESA
ncbi:MAG: sigma-70 family RNA polymerase sigma factor [Planctomycetota bacterium]